MSLLMIIVKPLYVDGVKLELHCCSAVSQLNRVKVNGTCISGNLPASEKRACKCWGRASEALLVVCSVHQHVLREPANSNHMS